MYVCMCVCMCRNTLLLPPCLPFTRIPTATIVTPEDTKDGSTVVIGLLTPKLVICIGLIFLVSSGMDQRDPVPFRLLVKVPNVWTKVSGLSDTGHISRALTLPLAGHLTTNSLLMS